MKKSTGILFILLLIVNCPLIYSDTVRVKGFSYKGKIIENNDDHVVILWNGKSKKLIPRDKIEYVRYTKQEDSKSSTAIQKRIEKIMAGQELEEYRNKVIWAKEKDYKNRWNKLEKLTITRLAIHDKSRCGWSPEFIREDGSNGSIEDRKSHVICNEQFRVENEIPHLFYMEDPKKKHPHWSDTTWESIKNESVFQGMSKEQVLMALGEPEDITTFVTPLGKSETWIYKPFIISDYRYYVYLVDDVVTGGQK